MLNGRRYLTLASLVTFSIAILLALLIHIYIDFERSYDTSYDGHDRVYRIAKDFVNPSGETVPDAMTQAALAPALKNESADVEQTTRMYVFPGKAVVRTGSEIFYQDRLLSADSTFFEIFDQHFVQGSSKGFHTDPNSVVITEALAEKYFGTESAIGKTISLEVEGVHSEKTVTAVIEKMAANSHFHFDMIIRLKAPEWQEGSLDEVWDGYDWYTYIKLNPNADPAAIQQLMERRIEKEHLDLKANYYLQPLTSIHLHSALNGEFETNSSQAFLQFLFLLELLLLVAGVLNFSNYTVTSSIYRLHELGVRRIHGATTSNLFFKQLLDIAVVLAIASALILGGAYLVKPFEWMLAIRFLSVVLLTTVLIIAISLWIFLSRANYIAAIKSSSGNNKARSAMMLSLIVFQFFVTATMISSVIIVDRQVKFLSGGNPGFLTDALVIIEGVEGHGEALKEQLLQSGVVRSASFTTSSPGDIYPFSASALRNSSTQIINDFAFVDYDYFDLMGIPLVDGRVFSREFGADTYQTSIVINKTAQRLLGSKGVGDEITPNPKSKQPMYFKVIGVVDDFHSASFHSGIRPMLFLFSPVGSKLAVRLSQDPVASSLEKINRIWKSLYKDLPLDSYFVEDRIRDFYKRESDFNNAFWGLGLGCLAIACSGLIIVSFLALRERRKEMCIRKIIGAAATTIYYLSLERLLKMIVFAMLISLPATYYLMKYWLSNFAYHIDLSIVDFAKGALLILLAAVAFASPFGLRLANGMPLAELRKE